MVSVNSIDWLEFSIAHVSFIAGIASTIATIKPKIPPTDSKMCPAKLWDFATVDRGEEIIVVGYCCRLRLGGWPPAT